MANLKIKEPEILVTETRKIDRKNPGKSGENRGRRCLQSQRPETGNIWSQPLAPEESRLEPSAWEEGIHMKLADGKLEEEAALEPEKKDERRRGMVAVISADHMGEGDPVLGRLLLKGSMR